MLFTCSSRAQGMPPASYFVEASPGNRAKCKVCMKKIAKDCLRIKETRPASGPRPYDWTTCRHLWCQDRCALTRPRSIGGVDVLSTSDRKTYLSWCAEDYDAVLDYKERVELLDLTPLTPPSPRPLSPSPSTSAAGCHAPAGRARRAIAKCLPPGWSRVEVRASSGSTYVRYLSPDRRCKAQSPNQAWQWHNNALGRCMLHPA